MHAVGSSEKWLNLIGSPPPAPGDGRIPAILMSQGHGENVLFVDKLL